MCWEKKTHLSKGLCGSEPYIAPELFDQKGESGLWCYVLESELIFRIRRTSSRCLGRSSRLLLYAIPGTTMASRQKYRPDL
jgi:hypothetical protein